MGIPLDRPLRPVPAASSRPWAGTRLGAGVGERWLAGPDSVVAGARGSCTLDELARAAGEAFVGTRAVGLVGRRFPLIVKLIDAADWLSLQVHPDDALAAELYGPDALGKAEAWLVLEAEPGARFVTGPGPRLDPAMLRAGIESGTLGLDACDQRAALPGDILMLEAGTLHAIGPGVFVYEIEQASDITFRISDWGRPPDPARPIHVAEALRAVRPGAHAIPAGASWRPEDGALSVREFRLEIEDLATPVTRRPGGQRLEVVTAVGGVVDVVGEGWTDRLEALETLIVPASVPAYDLRGGAGVRVCVGSVP